MCGEGMCFLVGGREGLTKTEGAFALAAASRHGGYHQWNPQGLQDLQDLQGVADCENSNANQESGDP